MSLPGIDFLSPWYLLLLVVLPVLWVLSYRTLAGLGRVRSVVAIGVRSLVMLLVVLALADAQMVRRSDRLTVIFLVDQSLSIPEEHRRQMREYVMRTANDLRDLEEGDEAGVIVFGRDAVMEASPHDDLLFLPELLETRLDRQYTNLAGAMRLARASFPGDSAKRVVVVTDGNENIGSALKEARELSAAGVSIDVVPVRYRFRQEVAIEKVSLPAGVKSGQPFDLRIVTHNSAVPTDDNPGIVKGRLQVYRKAGPHETLEADQEVEIPPGRTVFRVRKVIEQPNYYTYEARFVPDNPADDGLVQNNKASAFTHIRGKGRVLLIENHEQRGEFDSLADVLGRKEIEVTLQPSDDTNLFRSLAELQQYDAVVLANVPRDHFTDDRIKMLVRNTQQMGAGLIMMGGAHGFGAGGWTNTELEKAMPVDFQIKNTKVAPVGALAMIMHASEMPDGNHWQKVIGKEAIKMLGNQDFCGVLHWDGNDRWLWGRMMKVSGNRQMMLARVDRMQPGDMPAFDPAMAMAATALGNLTEAAVKHMIIISDGDPSPPSQATINALKNNNVTVSTMAVGTHGPPGSTPLQNIAQQTGGKYYVVRDPRALPRYYQKEARRVAQPLLFEPKPPVRPRREYPHEILKGIDGPLPPVAGFVLSTVKDSDLVEVSLYSPAPSDKTNTTILASWSYGLGRSVAFTTDVGGRWATAWKNWAHYESFFSQMVRWSMRPPGDDGQYTVATELVDGQVEVIVTALDKDDEFRNFLDLAGKVVGPAMEPLDLRLEQVAPGRYRGTFAAEDAGSYFVILGSEGGGVSIRTGVDVPYSAEFRQRETNDTLLRNLARLVPEGGTEGLVIETAAVNTDPEALRSGNVFRHDLPPATSSQGVWPLLLLLGSCLFFGDVFIRRVHVHFGWVAPMLAAARDRVLRRERQAVPSEYMERLRSRKAELTDAIETRRAAARFEPTADPTSPSPPRDALDAGPAAPPVRQPPPPGVSLTPDQQPAEESYTERLLKAKKKVWDERDEK